MARTDPDSGYRTTSSITARGVSENRTDEDMGSLSGRRKKRRTFSPWAIAVAAGLLSSAGTSGPDPPTAPTPDAPRGCTIFTATGGGEVLLCGNLDHPSSDGSVLFWPGTEDEVGGIMIGYHAQVGEQSWIGYEVGMNERGLAFGTNGLPDAEMTPHPERPLSWENANVWRKILRSCATVDEVIALARSFDFGAKLDFQIHASDASGAAVVSGPGGDGELIMTRLDPERGFLASTNFNLGYPAHHHDPYPCLRFQEAEKRLADLLESGAPALEACRDTLDAVHFEGADYNTLVSYACDLKRGVLHLYHFHQFHDGIALDLAEQLLDGEREVPIAELFPPAIREQAAAELAGHRDRKGLVGLASVLAGLVVLAALVLVLVRRRRARRSSA